MSFEIKVTSNLGDISVATVDEKGHSAEYLAQRCADKICGISENVPLKLGNRQRLLR